LTHNSEREGLNALLLEHCLMQKENNKTLQNEVLNTGGNDKSNKTLAVNLLNV